MNYIIIVKVHCSVNIWKLYLVISLPVPFKNCVHAKPGKLPQANTAS